MTCQNKKRWTDIHFISCIQLRALVLVCVCVCLTTVRIFNFHNFRRHVCELDVFVPFALLGPFSLLFVSISIDVLFRDASLKIFVCGVRRIRLSQWKYLRRNRPEITVKKINSNSIGMSANFVFHLPAKLSL